MKTALRLLAALTTVLFVAALIPAQANAAWVKPWPHDIRYAPLGEDSSFPAAYGKSILQPDKNPMGANDWGCDPSSKHPNPVVLVHGTWENAYGNWNGLSPILEDQGYCVYALNYGNTTGLKFLNGTDDMIVSANQIAPFVDRVLASTGASKVDLIGHSQGGAIARYYANLIAPSKVNQVIGLAPSNHATTLSGITELGKTLRLFGLAMDLLELVKMPAAQQQADKSPEPQSPFYQQVNGNGETVPGIKYTVIATQYDEVVTPWRQAFINGGGPQVDNIHLQDVCSIDKSEHLSIAYSKNVAQIVLNKLDPSDQHRIWCFAQAPIFGNTQLVG
ncbi:lipase (class 2) [Mumia flava]|uniref:Lipase (Class 2) n=1 Tax=Mumia flava TaxID=1348852 RepID=A0A2M9BKN5_9ACTN|nr:alpha/beta fold hydrolase [Mumia flava]PJJ58516.1 lipase (class 2) [Mumia flava]